MLSTKSPYLAGQVWGADMKTGRELHHFVTEAHRYRILQCILEHTEQLPTRFEIAQFCPDLTDADVGEYLDELVAADIVESVVVPEDERQDDFPWRFYGLSDHGWQFLLNHDLLDAEGLDGRWQNVDDPTKLAKHESAPRPDDVDVFQGNPVSKSPEQQLAEYKMVVEQTKDALYLLDAEGRYVLVNEAYETLTGYSRDELLGESTAKVLDPDDMVERRELIVDLLNEDSERQSYAWQSTLHTADGTQLPVEVNFAALEYGSEFVGIVGSARDISDRRRRQQELSVLSRVLRHNLGNKINVIQGYAEVIATQVDDEDILDYTDRIQNTSARLIQQSEKARNVHDLLQNWPPDKRPVDVIGLVEDSVCALETEFPEAEFTTELPDSVWVRLPDEFDMAVTELLRNAVEHTNQAAPRVRITVREPTEDGGRVHLEVADNGPGIPQHEIEVLSSDEETPLSHSEGLGLWMVRWIVNAADGTIHFRESELGGSCIEITLPKAESPTLTLSM
jgi:PAS domain S-box-containing protein